MEWFRGFTDAEGSFYISLQNPTGFRFSFVFSINLHIDDIKSLEYIQQYLQMGNIVQKGTMAQLKISKQEDIKKIIEIFSTTPLNSIKQLNFLAFKKAFDLYTNTKDKDLQLKQQIMGIKSSMNTHRTDYSLSGHKFHITPYWLLGMIEGDGSFYVLFRDRDSISLKFDISQSDLDSALLVEIKNFLNNLAASKNLAKNERTYLDKHDFTSLSDKNLKVTHTLFIGNVLIPFLDDLTFITRKGLDYYYWKTVFKLKEKGVHHIPEGREVIDLIFSQMNERRYSTYKGDKKSVDLGLLQTKIDEFLQGPSNYISKEGRTWIISLKKFLSSTAATGVEMIDQTGSIIKSWRTVTECAEDLNLSRGGVQKRIKSQMEFSLNNRNGVLKRINCKD